MNGFIDFLMVFALFFGAIALVALGCVAFIIVRATVIYIKCVIRRIKSNRDIDYMFKD